MFEVKKTANETEAVWLKWAGFGLAGLEILAGVVFVGMLFWLNFFPVRMEVIITVVLLLLSALIMYSQFVHPSWAKWTGRVVALLLAIIMIIGSVYIYLTKNMLNSIQSNEKKEVIAVYVLKDDPANTIADAKDYVFGYHTTLDIENVKKYMTNVNKQLNTTLKTQTYDDLSNMIRGLYDKKVGAIVLNQSYVQALDEQFPDFGDKTKMIATGTYTTTIKKPNITKNTLTDTFTIYLAGNDEVGDLGSVGRSDVNILITVNPKTKQILLVNTPRDYYVDVYSLTSGTKKDKLTHAGWFGVDASMKTLSVLYNNWDVDFYVRLNFTSVESIIDSLGGISIDSPIEFTTHPDTSDETIHFTKGINYCNGKHALAYCRERQNLPGGDNQRGQNQMTVIKGLVNKVASPSILYNYASLLESIQDLIQTNLSDEDIASMVKLTMDSNEGWNVQSYAVEAGSSAYGSSPFFNLQRMYVAIPDMGTVQIASDMLNKIKNGDVFDVDEYVSEASGSEHIRSIRSSTPTPEVSTGSSSSSSSSGGGSSHVVPKEQETERPAEPTTVAPTEAPVVVPTEAPTQPATVAPTEAPVVVPTEAPTPVPTQAPTDAPVVVPQ